jgi:hypothetical protein
LSTAKRKVLVLGSSFAGLTTARFIREHAGDMVDVVFVDRNPFLTFVPNIQMEVFAGRDDAALHTGHPRKGRQYVLKRRGLALDPAARRVQIAPSDRRSSVPESLSMTRPKGSASSATRCPAVSRATSCAGGWWLTRVVGSRSAQPEHRDPRSWNRS